MSGFKPQQRRFEIAGRSFLFVSYEAQPASVARKQAAEPAMWCLMVEGRRCAVTPFVADQSLESLDRTLISWIHANAMPGAAGA
ncbi:MAG TPA: hypothetical protein VMJ30_05835 [Gemmatimonadales bacterium]|nr:hypothetical protein [Gemmatimonadales bacterium]